MGTMLDTTVPSVLPEQMKLANGNALAGYVHPSSWPDFVVMRAMYPYLPVLDISPSFNTNSTCGDFEKGDMTLSQAIDWAKRQVARGITPVMYTSLVNMNLMHNLMIANGIVAKYWSAHYTGEAHLCGPRCGYGMSFTVDATQWFSDNSIPIDKSFYNSTFFNISTPTQSTGGNVTEYVGMASTPTSKGYWQVKSDGSIITHGDAEYLGGANSQNGKLVALNKPIVGIASHPLVQGYWLVASDGGVFCYGAAGFYGSAGDLKLESPVQGIVVTANGNGYWLDAGDGGVFSYGNAQFEGSGVGD
jgi:hypothetical protein